MIRTVGDRTQPQVPVETAGDGVPVCAQLGVLGPPIERLVLPQDDFLDFANRAAFEQLHGHAALDAGAPLIAELRHHPRLGRFLGDDAAFI